MHIPIDRSPSVVQRCHSSRISEAKHQSPATPIKAPAHNQSLLRSGEPSETVSICGSAAFSVSRYIAYLRLPTPSPWRTPWEPFESEEVSVHKLSWCPGRPQ